MKALFWGVVAVSLMLGGCISRGGSDTMEADLWDLVWISDRWGGHPRGEEPTALLLEERIENDLGVEVRIDSRAETLLSAATVLDRLQDESSDLREVVADAEVIVFYADPIDSGVREDFVTCLIAFAPGSTRPAEPFPLYTKEEIAPYRETLTSIYETILEIRNGAATVVRAYDVFIPFAERWTAAGVGTECIGAFELLSETIREAAAEFGIPTASLIELLNGPARTENPADNGYTGSDGFHLSTKGQTTLVEELHKLGYEPVNH